MRVFCILFPFCFYAVLAAFAHPRHAPKVHSGGGVSVLAALPKSKQVRVYTYARALACCHLPDLYRHKKHNAMAKLYPAGRMRARSGAPLALITKM